MNVDRVNLKLVEELVELGTSKNSQRQFITLELPPNFPIKKGCSLAMEHFATGLPKYIKMPNLAESFTYIYQKGVFKFDE